MSDSELLVGLVPAAGRGSRLAPFPCPKELFPIGYQDYMVGGKMERRPKVVSQYLVENMIRAGARQLYLILGDGKADIMTYYGDGSRFGVDVAYLFQERLTGMPGALTIAAPWTEQATVVFGMPDTIMEPHDLFTRLLERHRRAGADVTLGLFQTDNPSKFGMVELDAAGRVTNTIDKPQESALEWMWGCACWSPAFTRIMREYLADRPTADREAVLGDVFNHALGQGLHIEGCAFPDGRYMDIGTAAELDSALRRFHL